MSVWLRLFTLPVRGREHIVTGKLLVLLALCVITAVTASANTIVVDWAGGGDHTTIQGGIDAVVSPGDTVLVMPGTYTGTGNTAIDPGGIDIVLRSDGGAASTIIDCEETSRGFYFHSSESAACVVDGFTITNGMATTSIGGGMRFNQSDPTIRNCMFSGNSSKYAGGLTSYYYSDVVLIDCVFAGNTAALEGGAVHMEDGASITLTDCTLSDNSAVDTGGAAHLYNNSGVDLTGCTLSGNSAAQGGGLYCSDSSGTLTGCIIAFSSAGEAVYCDAATATLSCCDVYGNTGGD
jgi:parallel beta-helix repeat protein